MGLDVLNMLFKNVSGSRANEILSVIWPDIRLCFTAKDGRWDKILSLLKQGWELTSEKYVLQHAQDHVSCCLCLYMGILYS